MKKILTLLVMFLATWSVLCAQTPVFGYQAVVRTADNELVENTPVMVTITVQNGDVVAYSEKHSNITTDGLGRVSLLVGTGTDVTGDVQDVDWSKAEIRTEFKINGGETVEVTGEVAAAPYALEAYETVLTTDRIVRYVKDPATNGDDFTQCLTALNNNVPEQGQMWEKTRNRIINYIMNHRDIALAVSVAYLQSATAADVQEVYGYLESDAVEAAIDVIAEIAKTNRDFMIEVLIDYIEDSTPAEADEVIDAVLQHEDVLLDYVVKFAKDNRPLALSLVKAFFASATASEVTQALGVFNDSDMKQKLVDELFYNYLDTYIHPTTTLTEQEIKDKVDHVMQDKHYLQKTECDGEEVDICDMKEQVDDLMN